MFYCCENLITVIPDTLPKNLKFFKCTNCNTLVHISEYLSQSLEILEVFNCINLTKLPENLPQNLRILNFKKTGIYIFPDVLPPNLEIILCYDIPKLYENYPEIIQKDYSDSSVWMNGTNINPSRVDMQIKFNPKIYLYIQERTKAIKATI